MFEVIDARGANPKHGKRATTMKRALLVSTALIGFQVTPLAAHRAVARDKAAKRRRQNTFKGLLK